MPRTVGAFQRARQQQAHRGAFQQREDGPRPGACRVFTGLGDLGSRFRIDLGKRRQVMDLVDHQQRAMAPELAQMQVGRGGNALVSGDIAGQASARVRRIVGRPERQGVTERRAPRRIGKGLLGLQAQRVARHYPADPLDKPEATSRAAAITGKSDLPPPGVTAARMSRASVRPETIASITPASCRW